MEGGSSEHKAATGSFSVIIHQVSFVEKLQVSARTQSARVGVGLVTECAPEGGRYGDEFGVGLVALGVIHDGGEDDDGHREREEQEAELRGAALERVAEDAEALRVAREPTGTIRAS